MTGKANCPTDVPRVPIWVANVRFLSKWSDMLFKHIINMIPQAIAFESFIENPSFQRSQNPPERNSKIPPPLFIDEFIEYWNFPITRNETIKVGKLRKVYIRSQQPAGIQPTRKDVRRSPALASKAGPKPIPAVSPIQHAPEFHS